MTVVKVVIAIFCVVKSDHECNHVTWSWSRFTTQRVAVTTLTTGIEYGPEFDEFVAVLMSKKDCEL